MQIFNEINARKLNNELNVFSGILKNRIFCIILLCEVAVSDPSPLAAPTLHARTHARTHSLARVRIRVHGPSRAGSRHSQKPTYVAHTC